jgi:uncharacterized membrane protein
VRACAGAVLLLVGSIAATAEAKEALLHRPHRHAKHQHAVHKEPYRALPKKPAAPARAQVQDDDVEVIEDVEGGDSKEAPTAGAPGDSQKSTAAGEPNKLSPLEWLSHLHAALVHLPLAWVLLLALCDATALLGRRLELLRPGLYLCGLAVLSFIPAVATGLLRFSYLPHDTAADAAQGLLHRNVMYGAAAALTLCFAVRAWHRERFEGRPLKFYVVMLTVAVGLTLAGGHLGGTLVYGDDFLSFPKL